MGKDQARAPGALSNGRRREGAPRTRDGLRPVRPAARTLLWMPLALIALCALVLPASAEARVWAVKDAQGQRIGSVRTLSASKAKAFTRGLDAGEINRTASGKWTGFGFLSGHMEAVHVHHAALWGRRPAWQLRGFAEMGPLPLMGRIVKHDGSWLVQAGNGRIGYRTRGVVAAHCPAWAAGAAVFLVLAPEF